MSLDARPTRSAGIAASGRRAGAGAARLAALLMLAAALSDRGGDAATPPAAFPTPPPALQLTAQDWTQWGGNPRHDGQAEIAAQGAGRILAELVTDPLAEAKKAESRDALLTHYQAPLIVSGQQVLVSILGGQYVPCSPPGSGVPAPCGPNATATLTWSQRMLEWQGGQLATRWTHTSDWKPVPDFGALAAWEPVFHAVIAGDFVYVPAAAGAVQKLARSDGSLLARIDPFADGSGNRFVAGPLTTDGEGNVYYNAIQLSLPAGPSAPSPWQTDALGAWLVRISPDDRATTAAFSTLVPDGSASAPCDTAFSAAQLPWPPSPAARPPSAPCGSQRPGINVAPAIAPDGTIYTVSRAHFNARYGYLVAVNPDLTPRWAASLRDRLSDGCGSPVMPPTGSPGGCRAGARDGVDPATNDRPAPLVTDLSSASPVVAPDGAILYGGFTRYNGSRGHLLKFSSTGQFLASYDFGWDLTPAIHRHDGTYSVVIKDNHYGAGSYCNDPAHCPRRTEGPYDITQLDADLVPEWRYTHTNTLNCRRDGAGGQVCVDDHPHGWEWCINAPAVDAEGRVYANSEDGSLYVIEQGGSIVRSLFMDSALGAAYTPVSLGAGGRIYAQNNGRLFAIGD